jgi:L-ascorbate metabolism protein UlaG (beta-lactamase superfamily)
MDPGTISIIAKTHPDAVFVCPEIARAVAVDRGAPSDRLIGALGGETLEPLPGIRLFPIPSAHEDLDITAAGSAYLGYVLEVNGERIYHSGDCVPYDDLANRLKEHSPTLALLPTNGRDEHRRNNGVPGNFTLEEALSLCELVGIPTMIAHHWGMFDFNTISSDELLEVWRGYSGPTSWYIPSPLGFFERRPAFTRDNKA